MKKNTIFERAKFNLRAQREGESVVNFITDLYCLCEHCDFGTLKEELIRDRIVVGWRDRKLSEKMQLDAQLTLEKAISLARQSETVKKQQPILHGEQPEKIDRVYDSKGTTKKLFKPKQKGKQSDSKQQASVKTNQQCMRCLGPNHPKKQCPARDSKCHSCSKIGHWSKACKGSTVAKVRKVETSDYFLGEISGKQAKLWTA